jgi:hypothetical protein
MTLVNARVTAMRLQSGIEEEFDELGLDPDKIPHRRPG